MENLPVNVTDGIVVAVLLASGLLAFARGFVKELLSIVSWVGAILVTFHLFPEVNFLAREHIELRLVADGVTILSVFVAALVVFSTISHFISRRAKETGMGFLDRTLGFAFGLARGAVVVCLAYLVLIWLIPPDDHPDWVREARVLPLVMYGGQYLQRLAPEETLTQVEVAGEEGRAWLLEPITIEEALRLLVERKPPESDEKPADSESETGYKSGERMQLDRLFEAQEAE